MNTRAKEKEERHMAHLDPDTETPRKFVVNLASHIVHRTDSDFEFCRAGFSFTEGVMDAGTNVGWGDDLPFLTGQGHVVCPVCKPEDLEDEEESGEG
jgi:hypothetical protein